MHPLTIDGATNKRLLRFFICLENEFGYDDASNHVKMSTLRQLTHDTSSDMIQDMTRYEDAKKFPHVPISP
uniref:Uncharacterized protein n=1 Tax=Romanomermis culicivorax TaxID=13658 RepID=A0A915HZF0_ROMCU